MYDIEIKFDMIWLIWYDDDDDTTKILFTGKEIINKLKFGNLTYCKMRLQLSSAMRVMANNVIFFYKP